MKTEKCQQRRAAEDSSCEMLYTVEISEPQRNELRKLEGHETYMTYRRPSLINTLTHQRPQEPGKSVLSKNLDKTVTPKRLTSLIMYELQLRVQWMMTLLLYRASLVRDLHCGYHCVDEVPNKCSVRVRFSLFFSLLGVSILL